MEIPESFLVPTPRRVKRPRKNVDDDDPDFNPIDESPRSGCSKTLQDNSGGCKSAAEFVEELIQRPWERRKKICRSVKLQENWTEGAPTELGSVKLEENWTEGASTKLKFIERPEFALEDSRQIAALKQTRKGSGAKRGAAFRQPNNALSIPNEPFDMTLLDPIKNECDVYQLYLEKFNCENFPNFVMGTGKGTPGGPAPYEFNSLWRRELLPIKVSDTDEDIRKSLPCDKNPAVPEPESTPEVLTVVSCFFVGQELNLLHIARNCANTEYTRGNKFAPLIMRLAKPKTSALVFCNGRIIVGGAKSEEECMVASRRYARMIQKLPGYERVKILRYELQNVATHCFLTFKVRLLHFAANRLYGHVYYEPATFPGAILPLTYPRVKVIVFGTGSVIITGAKSVAECHQAFKTVYPLLKMYAP